MPAPLSSEDLEFREEVRTFLAANLPAGLRDRSFRGLHPRRDELVAWQKTLHERGWLLSGWPVEHGGPGWSLARRYLFNHEYFLSGAPQVSPFGVTMVGPVIYTFGTQEQQERFLPGIRNSDTWWCQGYSEPGAGSDLASLRTRAVRDGDHYVVSGEKIWTSYAQHADMMFALVRTSPDAKAQKGISFLLIDMKAPGVTVRPIIGLDLNHTLNHVFLDNVRVPVENRIGEENAGWTCAKFLLGHERLTVARVGRSKFQLGRLKQIAAAEQANGRPLCDDPDFSHRLHRLDVDLRVLEAMELRFLSAQIAGHRLTVEPSILKIRGTEIGQRLKGLIVEALGHYAIAYDAADEPPASGSGPMWPEHAHGAVADNLYHRALTIFGGSNEIQRNIVARHFLG